MSSSSSPRRRHGLVVMPFVKEDKILIRILFNIKDYNAKDLVRVFHQKWKRRP